MTARQTIKKWDQAAHTREAKLSIHPAAKHGDDEYDASGIVDAGYLAAALAMVDGPPDHKTTVIDFGSGDGRVAQHLVDRYGQVICADASAAMLELANDRLGVQADYVVWDGLSPWWADPVDAVFSTAVFIHHTRADGAAVLANLATAVKPGGLLVVQIPVYATGHDGGSWIGVTTWSSAELRAATDAAGLDVLCLVEHLHDFSFERIGERHREPQVMTRRG